MVNQARRARPGVLLKHVICQVHHVNDIMKMMYSYKLIIRTGNCGAQLADRTVCTL